MYLCIIVDVKDYQEFEIWGQQIPIVGNFRRRLAESSKWHPGAFFSI